MNHFSTPKDFTNLVMEQPPCEIDWDDCADCALTLSMMNMDFELLQEATMIETTPDGRMRHLARLYKWAAASSTDAKELMERLTGADDLLDAEDVENVLTESRELEIGISPHQLQRMYAMHAADMTAGEIIKAAARGARNA